MEDKLIPGYRFLVTNPDRLGGKPTIAGSRFSVSFILTCLAEGMSYEDIVREYSDFQPREHRRGASLRGRSHRPARCGCLTSTFPTA